MPKLLLLLAMSMMPVAGLSQEATSVIVPGAVFDGVNASPHRDWIIVTSGHSIAYAGRNDPSKIPAGAKRIDLPGTTLLPD